MFTSLSIIRFTRPDGGAVPSVAKPIAALLVARAIASRHFLGPRSGHPAIVGDGLVERSEWLLRWQGAHSLRSLVEGHRYWCTAWGILDAHDGRRFIA